MILECDGESGTYEEDEIEGKPDLLHSFATVKLVVDQEGGEVVADEGNGDVDKVEFPCCVETGSRFDDFDENTREQLVSVDCER